MLGQLEVVTNGTNQSAKYQLCSRDQLTRLDSLVSSVNSIALNIIEIPNLVQLATRATKVNRRAMQLGKGSLDRTQGIRLGGARGDASSGEGLSKRTKRQNDPNLTPEHVSRTL